MTLDDVILRHGGEAQGSRDAFAVLRPGQQNALITFLNSLVLFPPDDTVSSLDSGDPSNPNFPN